MTREEQEAEEERVFQQLIQQNSGPGNPTFTVRDLGFPEHTKIHAAAREIVGRYAARMIVLDRLYGPKR